MELLNVGLTGSEVIEALRKAFYPYCGSFYISENAVPTVITTAGVAVPVTVPSTAVLENGFTNGNSTLTCTAAGRYFLNLDVSIDVPSSNVHAEVRLTLNGSPIPGAAGGFTMTGTPSSGRFESVAMHSVVDLESGDVLGFTVANISGTEDLTVYEAQLTAREF